MVKVTVSMSKHSTKDLLHVATIGRTVGLFGDLKFHDKSDFPEQFVAGARFYTKGKKELVIHSVNEARGTIKIQGHETLESAKPLTNAKLYTTIEATRANCHLDEGEFFWFDIEGCEVFENGEKLGHVDEIERLGPTNYLSIITDEKLVQAGKAKSFLVPYHEPFIVDVDVAAKKIDLQGATDILDAS